MKKVGSTNYIDDLKESRVSQMFWRNKFPYQMQKLRPEHHQMEDERQIYLFWKLHLEFAKIHEIYFFRKFDIFFFY